MLMTRRAFTSGSLAAAASEPPVASRADGLFPLPIGATSHFVSVNGIRLHYIAAGTGPTMIVLHGWPETSASWHGVMPRLAREFTIVAPDLRGTGKTERPPGGYDKKTLALDIAGLIEHLNRDHVILVGHDIGGKAAHTLGLIKPSLVSKLVLVDCSPPGTENMDAAHGGSWHYGFHMAREFPEMLTKGRELEYITAFIRHGSHQKDAISDATISEYVRHYASEGGMTAGFNFYRAMIADAEFASSLRGARLTMPVLTISGKYGTGENMRLKIQSSADNLTSVVADACGHFVAEEQPQFFCEQVERFCAT
jgi:pimeloyl-ACP methyl ester carboxylesterase